MYQVYISIRTVKIEVIKDVKILWNRRLPWRSRYHLNITRSVVSWVGIITLCASAMATPTLLVSSSARILAVAPTCLSTVWSLA